MCRFGHFGNRSPTSRMAMLYNPPVYMDHHHHHHHHQHERGRKYMLGQELDIFISLKLQRTRSTHGTAWKQLWTSSTLLLEAAVEISASPLASSLCLIGP